jgi:alpha-glucosidase
LRAHVADRSPFVFQNNKDQYLALEVWQDNLLHFEYGHTPTKKFDSTKKIWVSPMLSPDFKPKTPETLKWVTHNELHTKRIRLEVDPVTLCVSVWRRNPEELLQKLCPQRLDQSWKGFTVFSPGAKNVFGLGQYFKNPGTASGDWIGQVWDPLAHSMGNSLRPFQGGANSYAMFPIAYVLGEKKSAYAMFLDHVYKQMWSFNQSPWTVDSFGDQLRWFLLEEEDPMKLRQLYMRMTGLPPVPPKSVFGLWLSEFGFDNWAEIEQQIQKVENHGFPIDGLALDLQWFGGSFFSPGDDTRSSRFGSLQFDLRAFPDPAARIARFRKDHGVEFMPIEESYISRSLPEHEILAKHRFLATDCQSKEPTFLNSNPWWGVGGMLDWTNTAASDFWHQLKRTPLIEMGITHHWTDLGEPEMYDQNSCYHGFPELAKHQHADIHNLYNFKWLEGIDRGYRQQNNLRHFALTRSGTSGVQRFSAGMWSGDIAANMGALTAQFNVQTNMSFSGVDYYGSDIGGFHRRPDTLDGDEDELYTQWFANSALLDFPVRPHVWNLSNNLETNPTEIGDRESNRANILLRYHLFPYYYSLAHQAHRIGTPIVAPPELYFPEEPHLRAIGHQKMIGPSIMIGIVARYNEKYRDMFLPEGEWISYFDAKTYTSKGELFRGIPTYHEGLFRPPLFLREGAIVPAIPVDKKTSNSFGRRRDDQPSNTLVLKIVPSLEPTEFTLFEDDGRTREYEKRQVRLTRIEQKMSTNASLHIRIEPAQGTYHGARNHADLQIEVYGRSQSPTRVLLNEDTVKPCKTQPSKPKDCWEMSPKRVLNVYLNNRAVKDSKEIRIDR